MKKVNICLGRFQPFTLGHYKMIEYGFKENGLTTVILMIHNKKMDSQHPFDDELIQKEMELIKNSCPNIEDTIYVDNADLVKFGQKLKEKEYEAQLWITGSDRLASYKRMAENPKYQEQGGYPSSFTTLEVPRTDEDISATKVREVINNDDIDTFKKMMPKGSEKLFNEFKDQLSNIKEGMKSLKTYIIEYIDEEHYNIYKRK